jgi:hypothetical protein
MIAWRRLMQRIGVLILAIVLCAAGGSAVAQEQSTVAYNTLITDEATGFLSNCTQVRIYEVDPNSFGLDPKHEYPRLMDDPLVGLVHPADPIYLQLDPGMYELAIYMLYLTEEVHYMYFIVADGAVTSVDVLSIELPAELVTY